MKKLRLELNEDFFTPAKSSETLCIEQSMLEMLRFLPVSSNREPDFKSHLDGAHEHWD